MSEFWVSKKKYFCKYCETYIADDAPSRNHHESGMRHKGNLERFIRGIYKTGERRKKDQEEEMREMARVEQLANAAFAQDVGAGLAKPVAGPSSPSVRRPTDIKSSNPFANYSTAESLGYSDPDAERITEEQDVRRAQGVAGEWQYVATVPPPTSNGNEEMEDAKPDLASPGDKRPADEDEDPRGYKLRKKTLGVGLGEIYDPGMIPIKVKVEKEEVKDIPKPTRSESPGLLSIKWTPLQLPGSTTKGSSDPFVNEEGPPAPPAASGLKWTKVSWGEAVPLPPPDSGEQVEPHPGQKLDDGPQQPDSQIGKGEPDADSTNMPSVPLFRKRKAPASSTRGRRPI